MKAPLTICEDRVKSVTLREEVFELRTFLAGPNPTSKERLLHEEARSVRLHRKRQPKIELSELPAEEFRVVRDDIESKVKEILKRLP